MSRAPEAARPAAWLAWSLALLALGLAARLLGADDGWDQTQPRTMAYAVDVLEQGRWLLPRDQEGLAATKPPLHPWLAAPVIAWLGPAHLLAHRVPSLLAAAATLALLWRAGRCLRAEAGPVGPIAVLMLVASAPFLKLAPLARPDMLLVAATTLGLACVLEAAHARERSDGPVPTRVRWTLALAIALGALAKGPAVAPLVLLPFVGRPRAWRSWLVPVLAGLVPYGLWCVAVARVDPAHARDVLLGAEVVGRVTGTGPEGGGGGLGRWLASLGHMPAYFVGRFAPWSVPAILALVRMRRRPPADPAVRAGLRVAAALVLLVLGLFTLSAGKRADYLAPALPAAALLAAWWCTAVAAGRPASARRRGDRLLAGLAAATVVVVGVDAWRGPGEVPPGYGRDLRRFAAACRERARTDSIPLACLGTARRPLAPWAGVAWPAADLEPRSLGDSRPIAVIVGPGRDAAEAGRIASALDRVGAVTVLEGPRPRLDGAPLEPLRLVVIPDPSEPLSKRPGAGFR